VEISELPLPAKEKDFFNDLFNQQKEETVEKKALPNRDTPEV
jgi:hypothetical protein